MEKRIVKFESELATTNRSIIGSNDNVGNVVELVKRDRDRDVQEKEELRHLNDRFSHFLSNIDQLKRINEQLQAQLKDEFSKWGILPRDENELRQILIQINNQAAKRANDEVRSRAAEQEAAVLSRAAVLYTNIQEMYKRKQENLRNLIEKLQEELNRSCQRERVSNDEVSTTRDDLIKELNKFRERLQDWLRCVSDKQTLLDDIQSLRERINLINALNIEEINEWKRLLEQTKDDSISFYKEELNNAIRDIKRDYSQQAKKFQDELEYQIEGQLRMVENQLKQQATGSIEGSDGFDARLQTEETKLRTIMEEYDKEQMRLNDLIKILSDKRRLLRDEEGKLHEIERKIHDKQCHERSITDRLKSEFDDLRVRFEQMASELRFTIEDELKIYSRLLDELTKKSTVPTTTTQYTGTNLCTTTSSTVRSSGTEDRDLSSMNQNKVTGCCTCPDRSRTNSGGDSNWFRSNENHMFDTSRANRCSFDS